MPQDSSSKEKPVVYRVETPRFVGAVDTYQNRITKTAPILRWATGMYITSLKEKLGRRFGFDEVKVTKLNV